MIYLDIILAAVIAVSVFKSKITFSDGLGIIVMLGVLYTLSMGLDYMGLTVTAVTLFVLACVNALMGLMLRTRNKLN